MLNSDRPKAETSYKAKYPLTFGDYTVQAAEKLSERRRQAWTVARQAAHLLKKYFGAQRVVAFGSLVQPARFAIWSDLDLAAWGIAHHRYYAVVAAVTL